MNISTSGLFLGMETPTSCSRVRSITKMNGRQAGDGETDLNLNCKHNPRYFGGFLLGKIGTVTYFIEANINYGKNIGEKIGDCPYFPFGASGVNIAPIM